MKANKSVWCRLLAILLLIGGLVVISQTLLSVWSTLESPCINSANLISAKNEFLELRKNPTRRKLDDTAKANQALSNCSVGEGSEKLLPTIYVVTPTYRRAEQLAELTRTCQTLLHVKNLVWVVVEDATKPSTEIVDYLAHCGVKYVYMRAQMPGRFKKVKNKPRGVANRNVGIQFVKQHANEGVIYFGDDDNTYDLRIFEEMRWTKMVSMFPVGLVTKVGVSTPIVREGKVIGFYDGWIAHRKFPVDMAGFAVNVDLLKNCSKCFMPFKVGYEEDGFLKMLKVGLSHIEPLASNCTKIYVWHTQTKKNEPAVDDDSLKLPITGTNLIELRKRLWRGV